MTLKELVKANRASFLIIHCLDVGDGDCTLISHPSGRLTLVDIDDTGYWQGKHYNTVEIIKYLYPKEEIFRYIQTHPDLDHMGGLHDLQNEVGIRNFWDVPNTKRLTKEDMEEGPHEWDDWQMYRRHATGKVEGTTLLTHIEGAKGSYWIEDGVHTFGPTQEEVESANKAGKSNPLSRILKLRFGAFSMLMCGDAEEANLARLAKEYKASSLDSSILRAPHHGRNSGICEDCLELIKPYYTIISAGKPTEHDATKVYERHTIHKVYRTHDTGCITILANEAGSFWLYNDEGELLAKKKISA